MNARLAQLESQIENKEEICSTSEALHAFPPALLRPYKNTDIGFIVCTKGSIAFMVGAHKMRAVAGETIFLPNDSTFQIVGNSEDLEYDLIIYQVQPIRDDLGTKVTSMNIYSKIYPHRYYVYHTGKEKELIDYIRLINACNGKRNNPFGAYELKLLLVALTCHLCAIFQKKMMNTNSLNARNTEVFLHLIQLIDKYYTSERGVEFYADKLCLSPKYLSRLSKAMCGYTVQELVFKAIIRQSKILLNVTNKTIQEISNEFDFPNASSFGTFFKKQTGTSPQKYREEIDFYMQEEEPEEQE